MAEGEKLIPINIEEQMKSAYIDYSMSVIVSRALPDVRDGLKPVHRRVLYGMHELGIKATGSYKKSARIVGEVLGKYHPHGDTSVYDSMVRMAQNWSVRYMMVDGQGNFGSVDGDSPAAMRYTEVRMQKISEEMLSDIEKDTVDHRLNFDDTLQEPTVLPTRIPNLLVNGASGIAVGMATNMAPHNLTEVVNGTLAYIQNRDIEIDELMQHVKAPDFPTGGIIYGYDGVKDAFHTGRGRIVMRAKAIIEEVKGRECIIVTEIPYQVSKGKLIEKIAQLIIEKKLPMLEDIRDESSKEGIRVVIEVKNNADPHAVLNQLFKSSRLQESYSANVMGILDGRPVLLTLPVMLHTYVEHREQVIERRANYDLKKAEARAHILEGLVKAQDRIDDVIAVGKGSSSREQFESVLQGNEIFPGIAAFSFTEPQSKAIAERRLYQLSRLDVDKVKNEFDELQIKIADLNDIIASRPRRLDILLTELDEMVERHGDERRSFIDPMPLSMDREDLIEERAIVITLTNDNYIRHLPAEAFRMQNRGGKGMKGVQTKNEDFPTTLITCFSKDRLLIFTNRPATKKDKDDNEVPYIEGRVYGLKAWETPQGSRTSRGSHIRNILGLKDDEHVVSIIPLNKDLIEDPAGHFLAFATKKGVIKKSNLSDYVKINRNGKKAINLAADDELITVRSGTEEHNVVMVSNLGRACRFDLSSVRTQGRVSSGVRGIRLEGEATLAGMILTNDIDTSVLTLSKQGMGKRTRLGKGEKILTIRNDEQQFDENGDPKTEMDGYRVTKRGGKGVITMNLNDGDVISRVHQVPDLNDQLFLLSGKGVVIRISAMQTKETSGRSSKGTRVMELRSKSKDSFTDQLIFSARMPAELAEEILTEKTSEEEDGEKLLSNNEEE